MGSLPPKEGAEAAKKDFGGMIASATNLAFAIELYMKALRILNGLGPMHTHDLADLYANFPKELRQAIKTTYDAGPKKPDPFSLHESASRRDLPQGRAARGASPHPDVAVRHVPSGRA
jgi:hypothetical protein